MNIQTIKKNIVILGGSGFVGQHLCAALAKQGHTVKVLSRAPEQAKALTLLPTVSIKKVDIYDQDALNAACAQADVVINLIGILNEASHNGQGFYRAHVTLAQKVVAACQHNQVPRLLQMSALHADPARGRSYYLRTKGEAENYVHQHAGPALKVTSFRPSVMFGAGDTFLNRFAALLKYSPGIFFLPAADSQYAPVYVGDVVAAMIQAMDLPATAGQRYDLCGPRVYTLKTLVTYVAQTLGLHRIIVGLSPRLSAWVANVFEYLPGKPFSKDNYLSTLTPSVTDKPFPDVFAIKPTALEAVAPLYLKADQKQQLLDGYRRL